MKNCGRHKQKGHASACDETYLLNSKHRLNSFPFNHLASSSLKQHYTVLSQQQLSSHCYCRRCSTTGATMSSSDLTSPLLEEEEVKNPALTELQKQLQDVQNQIAAALTADYPSSQPSNEGSGIVDVEFVKTKPALTSKLSCKKDQKVKTILHDFTAEFPEGCVTALMGPSGAGKTTLLDFVTGMLGSGVNGKDIGYG